MYRRPGHLHDVTQISKAISRNLIMPSSHTSGKSCLSTFVPRRPLHVEIALGSVYGIHIRMCISPSMVIFALIVSQSGRRSVSSSGSLSWTRTDQSWLAPLWSPASPFLYRCCMHELSHAVTAKSARHRNHRHHIVSVRRHGGDAAANRKHRRMSSSWWPLPARWPASLLGVVCSSILAGIAVGSNTSDQLGRTQIPST